MTAGQFADEWFGQAGEGVVDRIADVAVIDAAAIWRGNQLDDLARMQGTVHGAEGGPLRRAMLGNRLGHLAQGVANGVNAIEIPGGGGRLGRHLCPGAFGAFVVDDAAIHEPGQRVIEGGELLDRETIVGIEGVQKVEGPAEVDTVGVAGNAGSERVCKHLDNHFTTLDRLPASRYRITPKRYLTG